MGTGGNNVPVLVNQKRKLSVKECLSLQGFPSSYKIEQSSNGYKQVGNSVSVPVIDFLKGRKYVKGLIRGFYYNCIYSFRPS